MLARSLYQNFDVFVVSNLFERLSYEERLWFFEKIVLQYLMYNTVFYQSNDLALIKKADYILVFKDNNIVQSGTYAQLNEKEDGQFKFILDLQSKMDQTSTSKEFNLDARKRRRRAQVRIIEPDHLQIINELRKDEFITYFVRVVFCIMIIKRRIKKAIKERKMTHMRFTGKGMVCRSIPHTFIKFITIRGKGILWIILGVYLLEALLKLSWDIWLGWWGKDFLKLNNVSFYFYILIILSAVSGLYVLIADAVFYKYMREMASNVFYANVKKIIKAEVRWFQIFGTPVILYNMFNYQNTLDDSFNQMVRSFVRASFMIMTSILISNIFYPGIFFVVTCKFSLVCKTGHLQDAANHENFR